jgi:hypothetical protein
MAYRGQPLRSRLRRGAELQRGGEQVRLAGELRTGGSRAPGVAPRRQEPRQALLTLHRRDIARLDRFLIQGQRAALRADREFEGITIAVDDDGGITVTAVGMTSIRL